ncbi:hypothetical protein HanRHA438_Chr16g0772531 [Helianthus annuus]|nr:hypothetical protein HanRHA438_Chr16g0772531 [Helianthus annuus]
MEGLWFMLFEWAIERRTMVADVSSYNVVLKALGRRKFFAFMESMMWALEYDPDLYTLYEEFNSSRPEDAKGKRKSSRQCGKYEREYLRSGAKNGEPLPISVFLVASVLKEKSVKLLTEAKGLDDVVKVNLIIF